MQGQSGCPVPANLLSRKCSFCILIEVDDDRVERTFKDDLQHRRPNEDRPIGEMTREVVYTDALHDRHDSAGTHTPTAGGSRVVADKKYVTAAVGRKVYTGGQG